jgi:hypothetical protein
VNGRLATWATDRTETYPFGAQLTPSASLVFFFFFFFWHQKRSSAEATSEDEPLIGRPVALGSSTTSSPPAWPFFCVAGPPLRSGTQSRAQVTAIRFRPRAEERKNGNFLTERNRLSLFAEEEKM